MKPVSISLLTICGLEELESPSSRAVTHVLSILDPDWPDPEAFQVYDPHHRTILRFNDIIGEVPGLKAPEVGHVEAILGFGRSLAHDASTRHEGHLLIHCHAGISRSTAAMAMLLAQAAPDEDEDRIFQELLRIRPQAWPNSRMIGFADDLLGRGGRFGAELHPPSPPPPRAPPHLPPPSARMGGGGEVEMAKAA